MKWRTTGITLFFIAIGAVAKAQDIWSLERAVQYAVDNNISVKQADVRARLTALTLKQSQLMQYPTASLSASAGLNAGRSIDPTTNQFTNTQLFNSSFSLQSP